MNYYSHLLSIALVSIAALPGCSSINEYHKNGVSDNQKKLDFDYCEDYALSVVKVNDTYNPKFSVVGSVLIPPKVSACYVNQWGQTPILLL